MLLNAWRKCDAQRGVANGKAMDCTIVLVEGQCCDVRPFGLTCAADGRVPRCGVLVGNCCTIHSLVHDGGNGGLSHVVV